MKTNIWLIKAETNLHVGNENNANYGIIDKAIQRDALTGLPCINSSSLKGAINEYCCSLSECTPEKRTVIFGSDKMNDKQKQQKGSVYFFDAKLLFLPVQDHSSLYKYATCISVIDLFNERARTFGLNYKIDKNDIQKQFGLEKDVVIMADSEFADSCNDENLPIIARNKLENGLSANLWYEQVLPSKSILYFFTQGETDSLCKFINRKTIQIGANATIGYGFCKIKEME